MNFPTFNFRILPISNSTFWNKIPQHIQWSKNYKKKILWRKLYTPHKAANFFFCLHHETFQTYCQKLFSRFRFAHFLFIRKFSSIFGLNDFMHIRIMLHIFIVENDEENKKSRMEIFFIEESSLAAKQSFLNRSFCGRQKSSSLKLSSSLLFCL